MEKCFNLLENKVTKQGKVTRFLYFDEMWFVKILKVWKYQMENLYLKSRVAR